MQLGRGGEGFAGLAVVPLCGGAHTCTAASALYAPPAGMQLSNKHRPGLWDLYLALHEEPQWTGQWLATRTCSSGCSGGGGGAAGGRDCPTVRLNTAMLGTLLEEYHRQRYVHFDQGPPSGADLPLSSGSLASGSSLNGSVDGSIDVWDAEGLAAASAEADRRDDALGEGTRRRRGIRSGLQGTEAQPAAYLQVGVAAGVDAAHAGAARLQSGAAWDWAPAFLAEPPPAPCRRAWSGCFRCIAAVRCATIALRMTLPRRCCLTSSRRWRRCQSRLPRSSRRSRGRPAPPPARRAVRRWNRSWLRRRTGRCSARCSRCCRQRVPWRCCRATAACTQVGAGWRRCLLPRTAAVPGQRQPVLPPVPTAHRSTAYSILPWLADCSSAAAAASDAAISAPAAAAVMSASSCASILLSQQCSTTIGASAKARSSPPGPLVRRRATSLIQRSRSSGSWQWSAAATHSGSS